MESDDLQVVHLLCLIFVILIDECLTGNQLVG